ncbi:MAG: Alpha-D-glucose 1-phosphate phosphatase YihX [Candidatus Erwinia impunctatus]|nr:Alpha-D-glucose 1-phosphate phosphatase YihX [Culicoides impunctatus]
MQALRAQGERVVILSNTNNLHCEFWPSRYPEVINAADHIYLSQEMGMRKPEAEIYQQVLQREKVLPQDVFFFDDNEENIRGATALGIKSVLVSDSGIVPAFFAGKLNK